MNAAIMRISPEFVIQMFHLPQETRIVLTEWTVRLGRPELVIAVEHPDLPEVNEGEMWPEVKAVYKRTASHDHVKFVGWEGESHLEHMLGMMTDEMKEDAVLDIDLREL